MKKNHLTLLAKSSVLAVAMFGVLALGHGVARADDVFITGYSNGCFNCGAPVNANGPQSDSLLGLSYYNSFFFGTTANGFRGLGGNPNQSQTINNLGSFFLNAAANTYDGQSFTLMVTFTSPQGISGSNQALLNAVLTGTVFSDNDGGVFLDFDNTPLLFTFDDTNCEPPDLPRPGQQTTCGSGSFLFGVNDVALDPGQVASLTGQITAAQQTDPIPEPATLILLGTGLTGIAAQLRKRRKARAEKDN